MAKARVHVSLMVTCTLNWDPDTQVEGYNSGRLDPGMTTFSPQVMFDFGGQEPIRDERLQVVGGACLRIAMLEASKKLETQTSGVEIEQVDIPKANA